MSKNLKQQKKPPRNSISLLLINKIELKVDLNPFKFVLHIRVATSQDWHQ